MQQLPPTPYYAVIFRSRSSATQEGYAEMAARMAKLAAQQPGYLGIESVHEGDAGITVSYWESEEAIAQWKSHLEHLEAQATGQAKWYGSYTVEVARVERAYGR